MSRGRALGQGLCSEVERELEGAQGCQRPLCIARSEKQQVAWHMHALFLVLPSHSFMGTWL